ncbi:ComEC/Rec2 family competence protein [Adhaeribacter sp. BT258]|uniref:ComEC/Rec2 family competence protein n=1 Tax=Adhaeribacter terrigena TaxID=2793070 RepID=A0ABS1BYG2_9BACT|nr:ComEC/Rec2 family competence protein [Adhaeribacter terrigena]MBK0402181.1 ComEC/Rec2 family competence protein [Adhaeribacter terrigena]
MIKWAPYPFVRISLAFIAGIQLALKFERAGHAALWVFLAALGIFLSLYFLAKKRRSAFLFSISGIAALLCFASAGWLLNEIRTEKNQPGHLFHQTGEITHYTGFIDDFLLEKPTVFQSTLRLQQVKINGKWQPVSGKVQVSFRKEKSLQRPKYGDVLLIKGSPKAVNPPLNPGQFDYRQYLATRNIHHQQYLYAGQFEVVGQQVSNPVMALSIQLRRNLDLVFKQFVPSHREYGIASALVLGVKDELENDIKATYSNTGTMHVLAVSGLHVGLVFSILSLGLKRLRNTASHRLFSAAIVLTVVWGYAFITALSPSVLRAAVMFTFVVGAQVLQKRSNMYNTLATAAFALLCYDPFFLFDVGFQLSFVAVLAIVYLAPRIYKLFDFENKAADTFWEMTSVSLAAQIGTFPLSLYYFHQFPVYFLISNLIAVPLSTIVLYNGLALLAFFWIPGVNVVLGKLMQGLLWLMNESMMWLEKWPLALLNRIPFSGMEAILIYSFILLLLVFMARRKLKYLALACSVLLLFSGSQLSNTFSGNTKPKLIIFAVPKQSVWSFSGENATVFADLVFLQNKQAIAFTLEPVFLAARTRNVHYQSWHSNNADKIPQIKTEEMRVFSWRSLKILSLEKPLKNDLQMPLQVDYLVVRNNAWISAEKLQRNFRFQKLVFDSSNETWYVKWLSRQLKSAAIPHHDVSSQGAFVIQTEK